MSTFKVQGSMSNFKGLKIQGCQGQCSMPNVQSSRVKFNSQQSKFKDQGSTVNVQGLRFNGEN